MNGTTQARSASRQRGRRAPSSSSTASGHVSAVSFVATAATNIRHATVRAARVSRSQPTSAASQNVAISAFERPVR